MTTALRHEGWYVFTSPRDDVLDKIDRAAAAYREDGPPVHEPLPASCSWVKWIHALAEQPPSRAETILAPLRLQEDDAQRLATEVYGVVLDAYSESNPFSDGPHQCPVGLSFPYGRSSKSSVMGDVGVIAFPRRPSCLSGKRYGDLLDFTGIGVYFFALEEMGYGDHSVCEGIEARLQNGYSGRLIPITEVGRRLVDGINGRVA